MCWWGIWVLCLAPTTNGSLSNSAKAAQYGAIISPIFTVLYVSPFVLLPDQDLKVPHPLCRLLMFASGIPTAEKPQAKKYYLMSHGSDSQDEHAWSMYNEYLSRTSILIPFPPALYQHLPHVLKRTLFLDFPLYNFSVERDGPAALEAAKNKKP